MTKTDDKKLKEAEWIRQHTLTKEQTKELILNKLKRAEAMHFAVKKQRTLGQPQRWLQSVYGKRGPVPHYKPAQTGGGEDGLSSCR